jgi:hypothetical protein
MSFRLNYVFLLHACNYRKYIQEYVKAADAILNDLTLLSILLSLASNLHIHIPSRGLESLRGHPCFSFRRTHCEGSSNIR